MGLYSRAWLRTLLPSEESDQWTLLEQELKHDQPLLELMSVLSARQAILSPAALSARRDLVRSVRLFSTLEEDEVEDIASLMELYTAGVGSVIFNQGDSENRLFVVHDGRLVASSRDAHDNDMILTSYGPGDTFGILSLLDQQPQQNTVTAVTDCQIYTLRREDLLTLLTAKPAVGLEMMKHLATIIRRRTALLAWVQQGSNRATQPDDIALLQSEVGPFVLDSLPDPDTSAS
jgi:CRP-like cAMP-binding protein